ncbi:MAG TPA: GGDEF domain-containing protein, partial [Bauldia sp.]|nr:GGDEF domain-containing protein [Bauldia sp.]
ALNMGASLFLSAVYFAAAGAELVRRRTARLRARWLLLAFIAIHAALFVAGSVEAAASFLPATGLIPFGIVFSAVHFEQLIFALGSSIFLVAMVREESEQRHKTAARVDMLTGVASRRAFFESAGPALSACAAEHVPMSLVIFDLDRFKQVNDTFGHAVGDHVLNLFGQTAMARLRRSDIMGRLGGEEFAVAMPGVSPEAAYVMADRIRAAFANLALVLNGRPVPTLVSGGVAGSGEGIDLDRLIEKADTALYLAKHLGGNRIEIGREAEPAPAVIRVA